MSFRPARLRLFGLLVAVGLAVGAATATGEEALPRATFAGGCFWCMQPPFDALPGVVSTTVGYTGGQKRNPTYEEVSAGGTGHMESIEVVFDPRKVSYERVLDVFWRNIDPLDPDGQFCDRGGQYRTAIFFHDEAQRRAAEESKARLEASGRLKGKIATSILPSSTFWPAEAYHQKYYEKNPVRYKFYRYSCGRDRRLKEVWGSAPAGH